MSYYVYQLRWPLLSIIHNIFIIIHDFFFQVPLYLIAQVLAAILASETLCFLFHVTEDSYFGTLPVGSDVQSLVIEIIISFLLMFVISGVATDNRAVRHFSLFTKHTKLVSLFLSLFLILDYRSIFSNFRSENWRG